MLKGKCQDQKSRVLRAYPRTRCGFSLHIPDSELGTICLSKARLSTSRTFIECLMLHEGLKMKHQGRFSLNKYSSSRSEISAPELPSPIGLAENNKNLGN